MAVPDPLKPRHKPQSRFDPTGIDDGTGGIPVSPRRPVLRATAWIALVLVAGAIAVLGWRTMERNAIYQAYADGVRALAAGRLDDARMMFDRVLAKRPEWPAAWRQRGFASADPGQAVADFTQAIALDPDDADAYAARGRAWLVARQPAKGIDDLSRALELGARTGVAATTITAWRAERGVARLDAGDATAAVDDLRHVAQARDTPADHQRLAAALAAAGDWTAALAAYDRALAASPQAMWLGERAIVHLRLGDDTAAGVDLVRCAQLDPACAEVHGVRAGQLARELGRTPPAGAR